MKILSYAWRIRCFISLGPSFGAVTLPSPSSLLPTFQPFTVKIQVCGITEIKGVVMKRLKESSRIYF